MKTNIVHQYFKKEMDDVKIMVKVDPIHFRGTELTISGAGKMESRELEFDEGIFDDLRADEFEPCSPLEFNLYHAGLA